MSIFDIIIAIAFITILFLRHRAVAKSQYKASHNPTNSNSSDYSEAYAPSWLFSMNEKYFYRQLKPFADSRGLTIFAEVRLLDLVHPLDHLKNKRYFLNKIKSKHVDFVLCDDKLIAKFIIELDDNSHTRPIAKLVMNL